MDKISFDVSMWLLIAAGMALITVLGVLVYRRWVSDGPPRKLDLTLDPPAEDPGERISVSDLELECRQRSEALKLRAQEIGARRQLLEGRKYEALKLEALLDVATWQERANLAAILKLPEEASAGALAEGLGKAGSHVVGAIARRGRGVPYREVVGDVAAKLKLPKLPEAATTCERERQIMTAEFERMMAKASPEQREAILVELAGKQGSSIGVGAGAAALVVAHLSGFALYTAASATLAAVTGALGLTLPFATYIGLSSVIATVTGPVGWAALGVLAVASFGGANYKKTIPAVILVGTVRTRLIAERDQELQALADEQAALERKWVPLRTLRAFLDALGSVPKGYMVRASDVPR